MRFPSTPGSNLLHYTEGHNRVWYNYSYPLSEGLCATHQSVQCALFVLSLLDHLPILRQLRRKLFVTPTNMNGRGWLGQWARIPTFSSDFTGRLRFLPSYALTYASLWLVKPWARVLPISRPSLGKRVHESETRFYLHLGIVISWVLTSSQ